MADLSYLLTIGRMWWVFLLVCGTLLTLYAGWVVCVISCFRRLGEFTRKTFQAGR